MKGHVLGGAEVSTKHANFITAKKGSQASDLVDAIRATAVGRQAQKDGVAKAIDDAALADSIRAQIWEPVYRPYRRPKG